MSAVDVWRGLEAADCERFGLVWESKELLTLNNTLLTFIKSQVRQRMSVADAPFP